jgi:hypothetical protein
MGITWNHHLWRRDAIVGVVAQAQLTGSTALLSRELVEAPRWSPENWQTGCFVIETETKRFGSLPKQVEL